MTDTPDPQSPGGGNGGDDAFERNEPSIHAHAHYIKDLSFENPLAVEAVTGDAATPQVNLDCSVECQQLSDDVYEVVLSLEARAVHDGKNLFLVAVDYAGLFSINNVDDKLIEPILYIQCPTLLFPFARSILANITKDGGYPPLLIDIIDFGTLYQHQLSQAKAAGGSADKNSAEGEGAA